MKTKTNTITRERWLINLAELLKTLFTEQKKTYPDKLRFSCSWPARSIRKILGQCWNQTSSADGTCEIFITPLLDSGFEVADCLVHELVHAVIGTDKGHGKEFRQLAVALGLTGKMKSTTAGPELTRRLNALLRQLPKYPHAKLNLSDALLKKQGTRMLKLECPDCGYVVRTTAKWLEVGVPTCCCGAAMEVK